MKTAIIVLLSSLSCWLHAQEMFIGLGNMYMIASDETGNALRGFAERFDYSLSNETRDRIVFNKKRANSVSEVLTIDFKGSRNVVTYSTTSQDVFLNMIAQINRNARIVRKSGIDSDLTIIDFDFSGHLGQLCREKEGELVMYWCELQVCE